MNNGPEGKRPPYLPDIRALDEAADSELVTLRREDGSVAAHFLASEAHAARDDRQVATPGDGEPAKGRRPHVGGEGVSGKP